MKIKLDLEEIVIPSVIEEVFRKAKDKGLKNKDKEERYHDISLVGYKEKIEEVKNESKD